MSFRSRRRCTTASRKSRSARANRRSRSLRLSWITRSSTSLSRLGPVFPILVGFHFSTLNGYAAPSSSSGLKVLRPVRVRRLASAAFSLRAYLRMNFSNVCW